MSPAKATRPGFRQSLASNLTDEAKSDFPEINLFHPIYHTYTNPVGSRIDVDRDWPVHLEDIDTEDLIDLFSEPPQFIERMSPVSVQIGDYSITGRNWTEAMVRVYRVSLELFGGIGRFIDSTMRQGHVGVGKIPFTSLAVDPDTLHRIIELDYESGDSTYSQLMDQFSQGTISPCLTTPFHAILPLLSDAEIRLCGRISFTFYGKILRKYLDFLSKQNEEGLTVVCMWLPECAYSKRVEQIMNEEFERFCAKERLGRPHLVFLLDSDQTDNRENDVLMKSWNILEMDKEALKNKKSARRRSRSASGDVHPAVVHSSVVFRDRSFSDWVVYANPSVKKLLDRTIAKVDTDLNSQNVHYGWAHYEQLESLAHSPKSLLNYRQKLIKLTELGYVPLSPDFYVRGKLRGQLGHAEDEPRAIDINENSASADWTESSNGFTRWQGAAPPGEPKNGKTVAPSRAFRRATREGEIEEEGGQGWKLAWAQTRDKCSRAITGDLDKCKGGMSEALAGFVKAKSADAKCQHVFDFLAGYTHVFWREHFIQHDLSEADINVHEVANRYLRPAKSAALNEAKTAIAGAAAQAIYFALDSTRSSATAQENLDQRAMYQNVVMLTLGMCNSVYVYHWLKDTPKARKMVELIKTQLIGFSSAYDRHDLAAWGVKRKSWDQALKSHVVDSKKNLVARAAGRIAATHLRPLGYTRDFSRDDELSSVNVGHLWTSELSNINYKYENPHFCGVNEV